MAHLIAKGGRLCVSAGRLVTSAGGATCVCGGGDCCHLGDACTYAKGGSLFKCPPAPCTGVTVNPLAATADDPGAPGYPRKWDHYGSAGEIEIAFDIQSTFRARFEAYTENGDPATSLYFTPGQEYTLSWRARSTDGPTEDPGVMRFAYRVVDEADAAELCCEYDTGDPGDPDDDVCVRSIRAIASWPAGPGRRFVVFERTCDATHRHWVHERMLVNGQPFRPVIGKPGFPAGVPYDRNREVDHAQFDAAFALFGPVQAGPYFEVGGGDPKGGSFGAFVASTTTTLPVPGCDSLVPDWYRLFLQLQLWAMPAPMPGIRPEGIAVSPLFIQDPSAPGPRVGGFPVFADGCATSAQTHRDYPYFRDTGPARFPIYFVDEGNPGDAYFEYAVESDVDFTPGVGSIFWDSSLHLRPEYPGSLGPVFVNSFDPSAAGAPRGAHTWRLGLEDDDFEVSTTISATMRVLPSSPCPVPDVGPEFVCCDEGVLETVLADPCDGVGGPIVVDLNATQSPGVLIGSVTGPNGQPYDLIRCYAITATTTELDPTPGVFDVPLGGCGTPACEGPYAQFERCDTGATLYVPLGVTDDWQTFDVAIMVEPGAFGGCARKTGIVADDPPPTQILRPTSFDWVDNPAGCLADVCTGGANPRPAFACPGPNGQPPPAGVPPKINVDMAGVSGGSTVKVPLAGVPGGWCFQVDITSPPDPLVDTYPGAAGYPSCVFCAGGRPVDPPVVEPPGPGEFRRPAGPVGGAATDPRILAQAQGVNFGCTSCGG